MLLIIDLFVMHLKNISSLFALLSALVWSLEKNAVFGVLALDVLLRAHLVVGKLSSEGLSELFADNSCLLLLEKN